MIELLPLLAIVLYFVPFVVAAMRDHERPVAVLIVNLLTGWTVIGWIATLAWAILAAEGTRVTPGRSGDLLAGRKRRPIMPRILDNPSNRD